MTPGAVRTAAVAAILVLGVAGSQASTVGDVHATVTGNPLDVTLVMTPSALPVGGTRKARAALTNLGAEPLLNVTTRIRVDRRSVDVIGEERVLVGTLAGLDAARITWLLCARRPGGYIAVAQASGTYADGRDFAAESAGVTFTATPSKRSCDAQDMVVRWRGPLLGRPNGVGPAANRAS